MSVNSIFRTKYYYVNLHFYFSTNKKKKNMFSYKDLEKYICIMSIAKKKKTSLSILITGSRRNTGWNKKNSCLFYSASVSRK